MGVRIETAGRRRTGIDQHQRVRRRHPLEADIGRRGRRRAVRCGAGEHRSDQRAVVLQGAVEQRKPAVAMAEEAQHRGHPVDGVLDCRRRFEARFAQQSAQRHQTVQDHVLDRRAAGQMAAVRGELSVDLRRQESEPARQAMGLFGQADPGIDQPPQDHQPLHAGIEQPDHAAQMIGLPGERAQERRGVDRLFDGEQIRRMGEPGRQPAPQHVRTPRERAPAILARQPVQHQVAAAATGGLRAEGVQIAQPLEGVQPGEPRAGGGLRTPRRILCGVRIAGKGIFVLEDRAAAARIAKPGLARREGQPARAHPAQRAAIEQPVEPQRRAAIGQAARRQPVHALARQGDDW